MSRLLLLDAPPPPASPARPGKGWRKVHGVKFSHCEPAPPARTGAPIVPINYSHTNYPIFWQCRTWSPVFPVRYGCIP
jgi:hypothetical protein